MLSDKPDVASPSRASTPTPAPKVRCPRCGSSMGVLEATTGQADTASSDRYCGCCGLIVSIAR